MRTASILSAFAALAAAAPRPQSMDFGAVDEAPPATIKGPPPTAATQVAYNSASASAAAAAEVTSDPLTKRALGTNGKTPHPCGPQPDGYGPKPLNDSVVAFLAYQPFADTANAAAANPPQGYTTTFQNQQGSVSANTYLGLWTLQAYDTIKCQQLCDAADLCTAFNIYFERDPTINPADSCPNPPSFTNIKCTLWGSPIPVETANNKGQYRIQFQVVITGSNGYTKKNPPSPIASFNGPTEFGGAINAPLFNGVDTYLGVKFFNQPYDALVCASACQAQTAYNKRHATNGVYKPCNFFNAYILSKNNIPQGIYCSLYTKPWDKSYSTNYGQYRGSDYYTVSSSYGYQLSNQDSGTVGQRNGGERDDGERDGGERKGNS
ncbi:MAG: hypothetical protein M1836_006544 [Candelina mexicana]|nr:MAG: hypothetical protein M1836_006544 [Candelina mexicana]